MFLFYAWASSTQSSLHPPWLCLPPFQDINEMVHTERPDWQSVMTYVTAIYKYFETWLHRLPHPAPAAQSKWHRPSWALRNLSTPHSTVIPHWPPVPIPPHHSTTQSCCMSVLSIYQHYRQTGTSQDTHCYSILPAQHRAVVQGLHCTSTVTLVSHDVTLVKIWWTKCETANDKILFAFNSYQMEQHGIETKFQCLLPGFSSQIFLHIQIPVW